MLVRYWHPVFDTMDIAGGYSVDALGALMGLTAWVAP